LNGGEELADGDAGVEPVMTGGAGGVLSTMNWLEEDAEPAPFETEMNPVDAPAGTLVLIRKSDAIVNEADTPLKETSVAFEKNCPLI